MARLKYCFPEEMVSEILRWLPVKSLLMFRSVCKSWLSIISDPEFIKTHSYGQEIMATKKASVLMIAHPKNYDLEEESVSLPRFDSPNFDCYLYKPLANHRVIRSCNGIILCEAGWSEDYYLWNPSTRQSKELPRFPGHGKVGDGSYELAFGFDPKSSDYKVLRLARESGVAPVLQVYSTNTDSWKEIHVHDTSPLRVLCYPRLRVGLVINGAMYGYQKKHIVSFNLHNEVCTVVSIPSSMKLYSKVLDFEGDVAVIFGSKGEAPEFGVWTLDIDIHGKASWTKKFGIDSISRMSSYFGGGLFYGRKDYNCKSSLWDYRNKDFKYFPLPEKDLQTVIVHRETLASIKGFKPNRYDFGEYASPLSSLC